LELNLPALNTQDFWFFREKFFLPIARSMSVICKYSGKGYSGNPEEMEKKK